MTRPVHWRVRAMEPWRPGAAVAAAALALGLLVLGFHGCQHEPVPAAWAARKLHK